MAGRFSVEAVFRAVDRVTAPVKRMQNRVGKFTRSMTRGLNRANRAMKKLASGIKRGAAVVGVGLLVVSGAMANVIGAGAGFEQAIVNVGAVSLKTRDQIADLEKQALQLGRTTKFTSTQAANAMEVMARAGFTQQEILKATPAVLAAAAASGLEIAEVADHVAAVMKGLGLGAGEAKRVADVLALASARTKSSLGSLGESMKNVAETARRLDVPLEEVVASVALLQDAGLEASVAGSSLNTMLTKMAAPSTGMQKKMKKLGISFKDAKGDMLPFSKVLQQFSKGAKKQGGNLDQLAFFAELVGLRGAKAAGVLSDLAKKGRVGELTAELEKAKGVADKMAKLRMNTVQGSWLLLGSAVDAVKVKIFGLSSGPLKDLIDGWTEWVSANGDLIASEVGTFLKNMIENFSTIVMWVKRIAIGLAVFAAFGGVLNLLIGILTLVNLVMLANPITLIVLGVIAAIAAFAALIIWIDDVADAFTGMSPALRRFLAPLELIVRTIKFIKDAFQGGFGSAAAKLAVSLGFGKEDEDQPVSAPQMISPSERTAKNIEERRETSTAEVTIRDETGRAEVTKGQMGAGLQLQSSGAF